MRELSDDEVFGSTKELSDADVFGPAKSGGGIMDAVLGLFRGGKTPSPAFESVLNDAQPDPSKFNFKEASIIRRMLDDNQERNRQYGTIGPIVGPEVSVGSVAKGLLTDVVAGGKGARAGVNQMVGDLIGSDYLQQQARKERGQADLMSAVNTPEIESATGRGIYGGLSSLVRNAPSLALAYVTKSPTIALGGMAAPMLPEEYGKFRQRGGTPLESLAGAAGNTATEVATEMLPMGFLVKQFGRAGAGQFLTGLLAREVPGEQVATLVQDAIDTAVANPDKTWGEYIAERPGAAYQTLIATLTQGGIMGAGNAAVNRLNQSTQPSPQDVISRVMGQPAPAAPIPAAAPVPTPPVAPANQNALAERIVAAINGTNQVAELSDAEVFGNAQPDPTSFIQADPAPAANAEASQRITTGVGELAAPIESAKPQPSSALIPQIIADMLTNPQDIDTSAQRAQKAPEIEQVITAETGNATPAPQAQATAITPQTGKLGIDNVPMADGGKPFKTKLAATKAKKLQPTMRVVKVDGGFALADKTPAQLAAEAKAAKRIRGASTGNTNAPMSVHEFIAAQGGLSLSVQSDLGIEGNVKIGNRWLYAGPGKGMTIEQAAEKLKEAGYIDDELHNTAYDIIRRSVDDPQYTPEGWEQVAESERQTQFEDYLAAEKEAPTDTDSFLLTDDELAETGYNEQDEATQAEIRALVAQAEAMGIDADSIMEDVFYATQSATKQDYDNAAKAALQTAIQGSNGSGRQDSGQTGTEEGSTEKAQPQEGLTSYTPQEIEDRLAKLEQAEQERQQQAREAEQRAEADAQRDDFTLTGSNRDADVAAARGQQDIFSAPDTAQPKATRAPQKQAAAKIEDSGEVLEGARKLYAKSYAAKLDEGTGMDTASVPLSKSWPEPDYQRLIDEGADPWAVALARAVRDEIPTKPMKGWKLKGWVAKVEGLRDMAQRVMNGNLTKEQFTDEAVNFKLDDWLNKVDLYEAVGHAESLKGLKFSQHEYSFFAGQKFDPPKKLWTINQPSNSASATWSNGNWGNDLVVADTKQGAIDKFKAVMAEKAEAGEQVKPAGKRTEFHVYRYRNRPSVWIVGKRISATKSIDLMEFETSKEAQAFITANQDKLETMLAEAKAEQSERREENAPRVGDDHRNGADVTTEQFRETFGFRGEQFGASMPQAERQANMNQAYDALMDLAGVIGVPPKALSLNGELGLAFGARGTGGKNPAMAHYERDTTGEVTPNRVVINLTRKKGAGSLAHEWFHAVDNYFARMRGEKGGMLTESYMARREGVRPEMVDAFKRVMDAIQTTGVRERARNLDKQRTKDYWSTGLEMAARSFESYIIAKLQDKSGANDYLANILPESAWLREGSYPYPTMGELPAIRAAFDNFFQTIKTRETDKGVMLYDLARRQQGNPLDRLPETAKANVVKRLEALATRLGDGAITDEQFAQGAQAVIEQVAQRKVNRGPDWVQERLIRAKRKGELEADTVDLALWALSKNPAMATDLAIMVSDTKEPAAGDYNPVTETMRIFKSTASETTAVHEILHHTERMMPAEVQAGILREYNRSWGNAYNKGDAKVKGLLRDMLMAAAGDKKAMDRVVQGFEDGTLDYDTHYALFNPSEFWAVKASDIMAKRYAVQGSWVAQAKQWLRELIQLMKGKLGLSSDAPIIKALAAVLKGDGTKFSKDVLANTELMNDLAQGRDQTKTDAFKRWFGDSKVVDADGKPLVVYHGTAADFDSFDNSKTGANDRGLWGRGHYFSASLDNANSYALRQGDGARVIPAYVSIKNPLILKTGSDLVTRLPDGTNTRELVGQNLDGGKIKQLALDGGHDGVIQIRPNGQIGDLVAYRPEQIKSATGNDGSFDPANPNILRDIPKNQKQSPNRDALGRMKFRLGEVALGKLDAATRPLQERFGMRMASPELRRQLRSMKATIDQANRSAANVAQQMKDMPESDRAMVSDIVEKMIAPGVVPPEHAVRVADAITKTMDRQTDELVTLGMLSKDSADRWRGRYLPRIYNRKTELGIDSAMDAVKNMFKTGRPTMRGIGGGSLKGRGLFQDVSVDSVDQWLAMGYEVRDPHWKLNQGKLELVDKNAPQAAKDQVTVWRDWTPSERAQMGENRDALFRYVQGYTSMQRDIALGRLFNQIANNPDFVRRSGSEGWVKVPDTEIPDTGGVKRYGNLAGLYVRQDVMSHLTQFEESANDALQIWRDTLGLWKEGKTALNPVAHFNNMASNISMAHFAGVSYWDGHKYVGAARDLVNDVPMVEEAREAGLFTGSFTKEELMQNMPPELQKMMQMEEGKLRKSGRQVMNALTFWLRKPLQNAYEFEDSFFKYLIYRDARQQGMSPEAATDYALKYIFTYDDLPSGARKVRDFAIPFFSWSYKAIPALLHTAMVYPWRFLAPAAMLHGINTIAYALAAGDEGDDWLKKLTKGRELEKEEREALPERSRGTGMLLNPKTIRLGTDSVTGNPVFLDASRVVPGGDMFDMENQAGGLPIPAPLMPNHPVLSAFSAMIANKELFMGREVVDKNDTGLEAAEKRAKWMAGFMLPAVAPGGYHSQRILDATANAMDTVIKTPLGEFTGVDKSGLPVQPKYAAMQTLGIKARPVDLELEASRRKAQESALVNSIAAEVRSMSKLYQKGAVSDDMMERTRETAREKIERMREKE